MATRKVPMVLVLLAAFAFTLASAHLFAPDGVILIGSPLDRRATTTTPTPTPSLLPFCNTSEITNMDVGACRCRGKLSGCSNSCSACQDCPKCTLTAEKTTKDCRGGCTDAESECEGCGLWFHSICDCLTGAGKCTLSTTPSKGGAPIWMLTSPSSGDPLFTTTELLPGIQEMIKQPAKHDFGWQFAQTHIDPTSQALALNSYRVRDMEQIHIHVCERNTTTSGRLAKVTDVAAGHLAPVAIYPDLHCLVLPQGGVATSFATSLANFYATADCKDLIGAGILRDDAGRTWACATTTSGGPIGTFCHRPSPTPTKKLM